MVSRPISIYTVYNFVLSFDCNPYLEQRSRLTSKMEESISETRGWKDLSSEGLIGWIIILLIRTSLSAIPVWWTSPITVPQTPTSDDDRTLGSFRAQMCLQSPRPTYSCQQNRGFPHTILYKLQEFSQFDAS